MVSRHKSIAYLLKCEISTPVLILATNSICALTMVLFFTHNTTQFLPEKGSVGQLMLPHRLAALELHRKTQLKSKPGWMSSERENWLQTRLHSPSQTPVSLTSAEVSERSRCEGGGCLLWAENSWKKYLGPGSIAFLCPQLPCHSICRSTGLQQLHLASPLRV